MNTNITNIAALLAKYTCDDISAFIRSSKFHNEFKEAYIVPVHKKKPKLSKENYRPTSILPNIPKVYEGCLYDQIIQFLIISFQSISVVFERVTAHNTAF